MIRTRVDKIVASKFLALVAIHVFHFASRQLEQKITAIWFIFGEAFMIAMLLTVLQNRHSLTNQEGRITQQELYLELGLFFLLASHSFYWAVWP